MSEHLPGLLGGRVPLLERRHVAFGQVAVKRVWSSGRIVRLMPSPVGWFVRLGFVSCQQAESAKQCAELMLCELRGVGAA